MIPGAKRIILPNSAHCALVESNVDLASLMSKAGFLHQDQKPSENSREKGFVESGAKRFKQAVAEKSDEATSSSSFRSTKNVHQQVERESPPVSGRLVPGTKSSMPHATIISESDRNLNVLLESSDKNYTSLDLQHAAPSKKSSVSASASFDKETASISKIQQHHAINDADSNRNEEYATVGQVDAAWDEISQMLSPWRVCSCMPY